MHQYLILQNPGHNVVYYNESTKLAISELKLLSSKFGDIYFEIEVIELARVRYISFKSESEISTNEIKLISRLSFIFALFELKEIDNKKCLFPIQQLETNFINPKISSILKYPGKTNELFTKLLLNVTVMSGDFKADDKLKLLDPVAGRGTTMYEGTVLGFDVYGIEIDKKSVHEASIFFKKYLETEKYKHNSLNGKLFGETKKDVYPFTEFEYSIDKDDFKEKSKRKIFKIINGDTSLVDKFVAKSSIDIIVGDLPYGIAHANLNKKKGVSKSRSPIDLLNDSLDSWKKVLKPNGIVALSWNSLVFSREKAIEVFESKGFSVLNDDIYKSFEHRVDNSIKRDIIVGKIKN